jgi:hypothetical protein
MEHAHSGREIDNPTTHHEESDVNVRGVVGFAVALVIVALVLHVAVYLLYRFYARGAENLRPDYPMSVQQQDELPAMPRLQTNPRQDLRDLRAQEDAILSTYGWADRNAGEVRIPIDQAMKLTLQRGLPARNAPEPPAATSSGDANSGRIVGALKK